MKTLSKKLKIDEIFIATPSADRNTQKRIIERCQRSGCFVKILPELFRWSDSISVSNLRRVEIQDLLGRDQINVDIDEIIGYIQGKVVLVTLGIFTIVQLVRNVQMLMPIYDFCLPTKECCTNSENPCDMFQKMCFPVDEFFPPKESDFAQANGQNGCCQQQPASNGNGCGCGGLSRRR